MLDSAAVEKAESELDAFIERRSREKSKANELAALWRKSERAYRERWRQERRLAWYCYHLDQADAIERTAEALAAGHRGKAEALSEEGGGRHHPQIPSRVRVARRGPLGCAKGPRRGMSACNTFRSRRRFCNRS